MKSKSTNTQSITKRKLDSLKTHPKQADYFRALPVQEVQRLAEDIKANGLRHPVEILSNGTIVCGHQRVAATKVLGWTEIPVLVRTDLEAKGEQAVEEALIGDNLHRRQLDPIEKARCIQRLRELHSAGSYHERRKRLASGEARDYEKGKFRDYLGKEFGMSGRNVDRYLAVLKTPRAVQDAVSQGKLPLTEAAKVAALSEELQQKIVQEVEAGTDVKDAVRRHLAKKAAATKPAAPKDTGHFVQRITDSAGELNSHIGNGNELTKAQQRALRDTVNRLRGLLDSPGEGSSGQPSGGEKQHPKEIQATKARIVQALDSSRTTKKVSSA